MINLGGRFLVAARRKNFCYHYEEEFWLSGGRFSVAPRGRFSVLLGGRFSLAKGQRFFISQEDFQSSAKRKSFAYYRRKHLLCMWEEGFQHPQGEERFLSLEVDGLDVGLREINGGATWSRHVATQKELSGMTHSLRALPIVVKAHRLG